MSVVVEKIEAWLNQHGRGGKCIICGNRERTFQKDSPIALLNAPPGPGAKTCAVVVVNCTKCGHIELFSASLMGITPADLRAR